MTSHEQTHWEEAENRIATMIKKFGDIPSRDDRTTEALIEIAIQLVWMNAHLSELHSAVHRLADNT